MPDINILVNAADRASGPLKTVGGAVDNLAGKATGAARGGLSVLSNALGTALKVGAVTGVAALGGLAIAVAKTGIDFDNMKQQANIAFTTMLGDGEKAKLFLDDLQRFAAATPFEFPELLQASQRLLAMGFAAEDVKPTLTAIGDAVAGLGGSSETVGRVATALGQIQAKGKASAEEMMQLTEAGIPAWKMLADAIGVSVPEAMKLVEKGAVSAETTIDAVVAGMNANFGGMMAKQSQTFGGLLSTIKDTFTQVSGTVMQPIFELLTTGLGKIVEITSTPEFAAGVQRFAEWLGNAAETGIKWVVNVWPSFYSALSSVYEIFRLLITGDFRGGIFGLTQDDPIITALFTLRDAFIAVRDFVVNELPNWKEKWKEWALTLGGWIGDGAKLLGTQLNVWWTELSGWLVANLPTFVTTLGEWAKAAWQWIVDAAGVVGGYLSDWYIAISTWLGANWPTFVAKLGEWAAAAWQWIVDAAAELPSKLAIWGTALDVWFLENLPTWQTKMGQFGETMARAMADGFALELAKNEKVQAFAKLGLALAAGDILGAAAALGSLGTPSATAPRAEEPGTRGEGGIFPVSPDARWNAFLEALKDALRNALPPMMPGTLQPQSFSPSLMPQGSAMAASVINHNETIYFEQVIAPNTDLGSVRQAAGDGIREALVNRRLNG